jgi:nifR3 family TIM-barrel protein
MMSLRSKMRNRMVALAPVASITNSIYRRICKRYGADYVVTELVSSEGLGRDSLRSYELARFTEAERPVAVQIFGGDPEKMARATELVHEMRPDAIDINMGCPARKVVRNAGGSNLLRDLPRLASVVRAVVGRATLPVSVKIRAGWDEGSITAVEAARIVEAEGAQWITVHPRTRKQGFGGEARWEIIREVKNAVRIPVVGNGDIRSADDALRMFEQTGCDSVMIGRGSFGYPWIFEQIKSTLEGRARRQPTTRERVEMALENLRMELDESRCEPHFVVRRMRKHLAWYISGLPGSKELRPQVFSVQSFAEVERLMERFLELDDAGLALAGAGRTKER